MDTRERFTRIAEIYGVSAKGSTRAVMNRAIRTLPGGPETLEALEKQNATRNHAARSGSRDRTVAIDHAIDALEKIRDAMESHVLATLEAKPDHS